MRDAELAILDRLKSPQEKKPERLSELLRDPDADATPHWFMNVPKCFNEALDIRETTRVIKKTPTLVWTQGSTFAFKPGDILYDTEKASGEWSEALRHIKVSLHIRSATCANSQQPGASRAPGVVSFDVMTPSTDAAHLITISSRTLTQDEFVRLLISGEGLAHQRL